MPICTFSGHKLVAFAFPFSQLVPETLPDRRGRQRLAPVTADFQGSSGAAVHGAAPLQQSVREKLHGKMLCPALRAAFAFSLTLFKEILSTSLVFQYAYASFLFIFFFFKHSEQVIPILHPVLRPEG